jgi:hypothetical protein
MKSIITTAGLAALGAASLHAAYAPGLTEMERSKPWSVSATLRGFYDDNYALRPSGETVAGMKVKRDSFGIQVMPRAAANLLFGGGSYLGLDYTMDMRWYDARHQNDADWSHLANLVFDHAFSEVAKLKLTDNFAYYQEPQVGGVVEAPVLLRSHMNNMRNLAQISLRYEASRQVGMELGYSNAWYDYGQNGAGSYSALLDRFEHLVRGELRWTVMPTTVALLGYQFGLADHTSKDSLIPGFLYQPDTVTDPKIRNTRSHYFYVGAEHTFANALTGALRGGARYTEYPDALPGAMDDTFSPYADASVTYAYSPGSYAQLGVRHDRNQTDLFDFYTGDYTLDQQTTAVYGVVNHKITAKLSANVMGQVQYGEFRGGPNTDSKVDALYLVGVNLAYQFNPHFSSEIGYNYDRLDSDIYMGGYARGYDRNRVYIGVKASY